MWLTDLIFGVRPPRQGRRSPILIEYPPANADWRRVRPRDTGEAVRAWLAESDSVVESGGGKLKARGGQDMIVAGGTGSRSVVRRDVFDRTYKDLGGGAYTKRTDVILRYFTLDRPAIVRTLEGERGAEPGDWIMQGVMGELWPVPQDEAERKYRPA